MLPLGTVPPLIVLLVSVGDDAVLAIPRLESPEPPDIEFPGNRRRGGCIEYTITRGTAPRSRTTCDRIV